MVCAANRVSDEVARPVGPAQQRDALDVATGIDVIAIGGPAGIRHGTRGGPLVGTCGKARGRGRKEEQKAKRNNEISNAHRYKRGSSVALAGNLESRVCDTREPTAIPPT